MDGSKPEHVRDAVPLLSEFCDLLAVRSFPSLSNYADDLAEPVLTSFTSLSSAPVINMESCLYHPCQALADIVSIRETFPNRKPKKVVLHWTYHPKALPLAVGNSFGLAALQSGYDLTVVNPPEYDLPSDLMGEMQSIAKLTGSSITQTHNRDEALNGAEVIYAKSWASSDFYGNSEKDLATRQNYKDWIINRDAMNKTDNGYFMHCLPVRRNVEVTDEVIDSSHSLTQRQGQNRLHVQKTIISSIMS
jgi:N-acetylornithine carbamoyltransferase